MQPVSPHCPSRCPARCTKWQEQWYGIPKSKLGQATVTSHKTTRDCGSQVYQGRRPARRTIDLMQPVSPHCPSRRPARRTKWQEQGYGIPKSKLRQATTASHTTTRDCSSQVYQGRHPFWACQNPFFYSLTRLNNTRTC